MAENIGEKLYELRKQHQVSQEELAEMLHVSRQSVSKWENNSSVPELGKLVQICELFDLSLDELVRGQRPEAEIPVPEEKRWFGIKAEIFLKLLGILSSIMALSVGIFQILDSVGQYEEMKKFKLQFGDPVYTVQEYLAEQPWLVLQGIFGVFFLALALYMIWDLQRSRKGRWIYAGAFGLILAGGEMGIRELTVIRGQEDIGKGAWERLAQRLLYQPWIRTWILCGAVLIILGILLAVWYRKREGKNPLGAD